MSEGLIQNNFDKRVEALDAVIRSSLAELELMMEPTEPVTTKSRESLAVTADSRNVFLVHGHDEAARETVARFLENLDLHPIILHEQPSMGKTVIEQFEAHADVGFAVVLLTPDDMGGLASEGELKPRARQNAILELGYFIGTLGRSRVCALYVEGVEIPSDFHGVVYVPYDAAGGWRLKLASEIRAAGLPVDMNRA
jgi:predicted nucleotide-binding protein